MSMQTSYLPADTAQPILDHTAGTLLRASADDAGDRTALIAVAPGEAPRTWTYQELLDDSERAAQWLLARFEPGEHLAIWAPNVPEWVILQYGAALAGLVVVTANPALRPGELEYVLDQSEAVGIAYVDSFRGTDMAAAIEEVLPQLPRIRERIRFADWLADVRADPPLSPRDLPAVAPTAPAQVQYTSGTTGAPKGALLHHRGLITNAWHVHRRAQVPPGATWATALPLFHTAGCGLAVLGTAANRGTLVLCQLFDPELVLDALERHRADVFGGVPAMYVAMLAHPAFASADLSSVALTLSGGDGVPPDLVTQVEETFDARFSIVYGQTELSPIVAQTGPEDHAPDRASSVGRPLWHVETKIADPATGEPVPLGTVGEICARGYQIMLGYWRMPEQTAATVDGGGWLHTGDLGTMDERGYLRVTGRLKDMIIRGGENIYPREIEAVLHRHPGVAGAAVVGLPDADWGEIVAAVVQPQDPENPPAASELRALVREHLAPAKTPVVWHSADALPANAMGKLQKFKLVDGVRNGTVASLD